MGWTGQPVQLVELSNKLEILKGQTSGSQPNIIDINDKKKVGRCPSFSEAVRPNEGPRCPAPIFCGSDEVLSPALGRNIDKGPPGGAH